jgi:hypothetical protein
MNDTILTGGCYCGDIRYRIESKILRSATCRCTSCARTAGTHAVTWLTVPSDGVVLIAGEPERRVDDTITRTFCGHCGTKLTNRDDARGETDITVSSLDGGKSVLTEAKICQHKASPYTLSHPVGEGGSPREPGEGRLL